MMSAINAILFEKKDIKDLLKRLNLKIDDNNCIIYENKIAHCEACECEITTENLGNISKGTKHFYCDRPSCFAYRSVEMVR